MQYINNEILELNVITQSVPASRWVRCDSCNHEFERGEKKVKWRTHLKDTNYAYAVWHLQCKECSVNSMKAIMEQLNALNFNAILNL